MIRLIFTCFLGLMFSAFSVSAQVRVKGYVRKDGTYVAPHYRSAPNSSKSDNYSTKGNYNPYTGKKGTADPYPSYSGGYQSYAPTFSPQPSTESIAPAEVIQPTNMGWRESQREAALEPMIQPDQTGLSQLLQLRDQIDREIETEIRAIQAPQVRLVDVWKCVDAYGSVNYIAYPRSGCEQISVQIER